jgi:hypothetical protein
MSTRDARTTSASDRIARARSAAPKQSDAGDRSGSRDPAARERSQYPHHGRRRAEQDEDRARGQRDQPFARELLVRMGDNELVCHGNHDAAPTIGR